MSHLTTAKVCLRDRADLMTALNKLSDNPNFAKITIAENSKITNYFRKEENELYDITVHIKNIRSGFGFKYNPETGEFDCIYDAHTHSSIIQRIMREYSNIQINKAVDKIREQYGDVSVSIKYHGNELIAEIDIPEYFQEESYSQQSLYY